MTAEAPSVCWSGARADRFARLCAVAAFMLGAAVLLGWILDVATLRGPVPGMVEMKANTAAGFVLCAASLALVGRRGPRVTAVGHGMALLAAAIGAVTLVEYLTGTPLGIDELLVDDPAGAAHTVHPGRLAPQTAVSFVLVGAALLAAGRYGRGARLVLDGGCAVVALLSLFAILGYAYRAGSLSTVSGFTPMALHTAVGFLALAAGLATAGLSGTMRRALLSDSVGASMTRRLLPVALVALPAFGWLRLEGERAGWYDADTGVALMVLGFIVVLAAGLAKTADVLNRADRQRRDSTEAEHRLAEIVASSGDAIISSTLDGRVTSWNAAAEKLFGYRAEDMLGQPLARLAPKDQPTDTSDVLRQVLRGERVAALDVVRRTKHGREILVSLTASPIANADGTVTGASAIYRDVTEIRRVQEDLASARAAAQQALRDPLTGLPNRTLFLDRLGHALAGAGRGARGRGGAAVLFIDLDGFKRVNDSLGHQGGDQILRAVADRLSRAVRPADTVSRLGADEFTVLCAGVSESREASAIAERVAEELAEPIDLEGRELVLSASIGISISAGGDAADLAVRRADAAMYAAKRDGGACHRVYTEEVGLVPAESLSVEADLRHAVPDQLELVYQPQVDLHDGNIVAVEALLRWRHPERGIISPAEFIPVAEASGLILPIGAWVLEQAVDQLRRWDHERPGGRRINIAVNVSPRQIRDASLVTTVRQALERSGIAPERLHLEITETVLLEDTREHLEVLQALRQLGVRLVLDDFGTGFSSLNYLKRFPLDVVKIDRSFVAGLPTRRDDVAIVTAVLAFAEALHLDVVAEGLETGEHLDALERMGCPYAQGFYFSRPVPPQDIGHLLSSSSLTQPGDVRHLKPSRASAR